MQGRDNDLHRDRWRQRHCAGERKVPGWWTTRLSWPASEHGKSEAHPGSDFWNSLQVRVDRTKRAYRKGSMVNIPSGYDIRHCRLLSGSVGSRGCISPRTPSFLSPFLSEHLLPHFASPPTAPAHHRSFPEYELQLPSQVVVLDSSYRVYFRERKPGNNRSCLIPSICFVSNKTIPGISKFLGFLLHPFNLISSHLLSSLGPFTTTTFGRPLISTLVSQRAT